MSRYTINVLWYTFRCIIKTYKLTNQPTNPKPKNKNKNKNKNKKTKNKKQKTKNKNKTKQTKQNKNKKKKNHTSNARKQRRCNSDANVLSVYELNFTLNTLSSVLQRWHITKQRFIYHTGGNVVLFCFVFSSIITFQKVRCAIKNKSEIAVVLIAHVICVPKQYDKTNDLLSKFVVC